MAALVDRDQLLLEPLSDEGPEPVSLFVAGNGALLVAKLHKLADRLSDQSRLSDKDALDVYRLMIGTRNKDMIDRLAGLGVDEKSSVVTMEARSHLDNLFGSKSAPGLKMIVRSLEGLQDPSIVAASAEALAQDLLKQWIP